MPASEIIKSLIHDVSELRLPHGIPFGEEQIARTAFHYADLIDQLAVLVAKAQSDLVSDCIDFTEIGDVSEWKNHELLMIETAQESYTTDIRSVSEALTPDTDPNAEHRLTANQLGLSSVAAE